MVVWVGSLVKPSLPKHELWSRSSSNDEKNGDEKLPEGSSVMCRKSAGKAQACLDPAEVVYLDRLLSNLLDSWQIDVENKDEFVVNLPYDGGKEDPVDLNRQDEGEVEEQSGGIPQ